MVQGRFDGYLLISPKCLVGDLSENDKANVEVNPHNALSVWDERNVDNLQEGMDNNMESHKWNHEPREWGKGCLREPLLQLIGDGVYPPTVLKACITSIFSYKGLLHRNNRVCLSYEFLAEIDEHDDIIGILM